MNQILDFDLILNAKINVEYFRFFTVNDAFSRDNLHKEIVSDLPEVNQGGSFPLESLTFGKNAENLIKELQSKKMRNILEQKFEVNLTNKPMITTFRGYSRLRDGKIHSDSETKVVTVLIYLNETWNQKGGLLRMLKEKNNLEDYIEEVPATMGSLVAFKVTENCWHGFKAYEGKRCSIQLNYLYKNTLSQHNFRHKLSSFFKRLS